MCLWSNRFGLGFICVYTFYRLPYQEIAFVLVRVMRDLLAKFKKWNTIHVQKRNTEIEKLEKGPADFTFQPRSLLQNVQNIVVAAAYQRISRYTSIETVLFFP